MFETELLKDFPVVIDAPVAWGEMDAFQHINNIVYFRYFESARIAYFGKTGWLEELESTKIGPILKHTQCTFRLPLAYPDHVSIGAKVGEIQEDRFLMEYCVVSHKFKKVAAEGDGMIVCLNYKTGAKVPVPDSIRAKMEGLKNKNSVR